MTALCLGLVVFFAVVDTPANAQVIYGTVPQQIARSAIPCEGFPELLRGPFSSRMCRDCEMQNPPPVVREHHKRVQNSKTDRGHGEEIDRHQTTDVIFEE